MGTAEHDPKVVEILKQCEEIAMLQKYIKAQCMVYQRDAKVTAALERGLPFDAFFQMSYEEWSKIR
jgi:hypothetical protein